MYKQNKEGAANVNSTGMYVAEGNFHGGTAFIHPFVASENTAVHSTDLNPANVIYSKANNDVKLPTTIKPDKQANDNVHGGTAFVHPFVADGATVDHSSGLRSTNGFYSKHNNDVKLPMMIKPDTQDNKVKKPKQDWEKKAPPFAPDPGPWTLKKICVTYAMGTSNHGIANANRLWVAGYKYCGVALILFSSFMPTIGFIFGFVGVRDMLKPSYSGTSITVVNDKQTGLAFPKILLSNSGFFNYTALQHYNVSQYEASLITTLLVGKFAYTDTLERNIDKVNKDYNNLLHRLNTSAHDVWNLLSYKCHEIIIECLLNTKHIPGPICCKEHFETVLGSFGSSIMSKTTFIQERESVAAGLTLSLRVPVQGLDLDWDYINRGATFLKTGLRVNIIDNNRDYSASTSSIVPVHGLDRTLVTLSYDLYDNTGMHQSLVPWLDSAANCTSSDVPYQERATIEGKCVFSSLHVCAHLLRNCSFVSYPFWNGEDRFCDFKDQQFLIRSAKAAKCRSDHVAKCGQLCQEDDYSFSAQSTPLMQFIDMPEKDINSMWAVEGAFTMFYTHLEHSIYAQTRANLVVLLCYLGGTMSLFMGASYISIGELVTVLSGIFIWIVSRIVLKFSSRGCYCDRRRQEMSFQ